MPIPLSVRPRTSWPRADHVLYEVLGKSAAKSNQASHLTALLVLRGSRWKSALFPCRINELPLPSRVARPGARLDPGASVSRFLAPFRLRE